MSAIDGRVSLTAWSEGQFRAACAESSDLQQHREYALVAEHDEQVQGFVVCQVVFDELSILNVAVSPAKQRQGIARALLNQVLATAPTGVLRCLLDVRESNIAARALYRKMGFDEDGLRRNYYTRPEGREDAVLMSLQVPDRDSKGIR